jgi:uncharacterized protein YggE
LAGIGVTLESLIARISLLLVALALVAAAPASAQTAVSDQRSITVTGLGLVSSPNDTAALTLTVRTKHGTAAKALADTSARTRRVLAALAAKGIATEDIQTQVVSVSRSLGPKRAHQRRKVIYTASNGLSVTVRQISKTGAVIQAAVKAGATAIGRVEFFPSNEGALYRQALGLAYDDAHEKAQLLAERAGVTLGQVLAIQEGQDSFEPFSAQLATAASDVPIAAGASTIFANATVVFAIS